MTRVGQAQAALEQSRKFLAIAREHIADNQTADVAQLRRLNAAFYSIVQAGHETALALDALADYERNTA